MVASPLYAVFKSSSSFYQMLFHWLMNTVYIVIDVEHRNKFDLISGVFGLIKVNRNWFVGVILVFQLLIIL